MTIADGAAHDRRQRQFLIGLAALFFTPLAASFFLYYGGEWRPGHRVNRGDLINPARPLPEVSLPLARAAPADTATALTSPSLLKGKWTLLYWGPGRCTPRCREILHDTRQVRTALNRDRDRVQRVYVADGECCDWEFLAQNPDLIIVHASAEAAPLLALLPSFNGISPAQADRIYLVDPLGNLMMSYAPDSKPKGMLEDIKRLLGLSSVG